MPVGIVVSLPPIRCPANEPEKTVDDGKSMGRALGHLPPVRVGDSDCSPDPISANPSPSFGSSFAFPLSPCHTVYK